MMFERRQIILWTMTAASFLTPFNGGTVNVTLPIIAREMGMGAVTLNWINLSYLLAAAVLLIPFGRMGDLWGRKKIFLCGLIFFTLASAALALSPTPLWLLLFRALQGLAGAMTFATGLPILIAAFPEEERGRAIGINVAGVYLGLTAGPLLGGLICQHWGWRAVFACNVPLCLTVLFLVWRKLPADRAAAEKTGLDLGGGALYAAGLLLLLVGFSRLPQPSGWHLGLAGAALLAVFLLWELKAAAPILDIRLFAGNRRFVFSNVAALINYSATFAVVFLLSLYLQYIKGLSPQQAGLTLAVQPAVQALFSPLSGRLSDKVEPRYLASSGMILTALGLCGLRFLQMDTPLWFVLISLAITGLSFALFSSPNTREVISAVDPAQHGLASGTLSTMRLSGQMASMAAVTLIFALFLGQQPIGAHNHRQLLAGTRAALTLFTCLCLGGVLTSLARGRRPQG